MSEALSEEQLAGPADDGGDTNPPASEESRRPLIKRKVSITEAPRDITRRRLQFFEEQSGNLPEDYAELDAVRPRERGDCAGGMRPCPFVACQYNLYLDVNPNTGSITYNYPNQDPDEIEGESCVLDIAAKGGVTLEEVSSYLCLTRERVRQIETNANAKLKKLRVIQEVRAAGFEHESIQHVPSDEGEGTGGGAGPSELEDQEVEDFIFKSWRIYERTSRELQQGIRPRTLTKDEITELVAGHLKTATIMMNPAPEAPKENNNMGRPLAELPLTEREQRIVDAYLELAKKLGFKPKPSDVGHQAGIKGLKPGSLSANVCTALTAAIKKGIELPYFNEKRPKKPRTRSESQVKVASSPRPKSTHSSNRGRKKKKMIPSTPPASTSMVASELDVFKSTLLTQREALEKKIAAINVLLGA